MSATTHGVPSRPILHYVLFHTHSVGKLNYNCRDLSVLPQQRVVRFGKSFPSPLVASRYTHLQPISCRYKQIRVSNKKVRIVGAKHSVRRCRTCVNSLFLHAPVMSPMMTAYARCFAASMIWSHMQRVCECGALQHKPRTRCASTAANLVSQWDASAVKVHNPLRKRIGILGVQTSWRVRCN
jgi:hypothetical protein